MSKVVSLFKQLNVDVVTRWKTAHSLVTESQEWDDDSELRKLPTLDILLAFEDYSRVREREYEEQMRRSQVEKTRRERKARESFKVSTLYPPCPFRSTDILPQDLLQGLVDSGKIKARTKWKEIYLVFKDDDRYLSMLGNPGSNPLELFWDVVDILDQKLDEKISVIEEAIRRHNDKLRPAGETDADEPAQDVKLLDEADNGFTVGPGTTEDEFKAVVRGSPDDAVKALRDEDLRIVYTTVSFYHVLVHCWCSNCC